MKPYIKAHAVCRDNIKFKGGMKCTLSLSLCATVALHWGLLLACAKCSPGQQTTPSRCVPGSLPQPHKGHEKLGMQSWEADSAHHPPSAPQATISTSSWKCNLQLLRNLSDLLSHLSPQTGVAEGKRKMYPKILGVKISIVVSGGKQPIAVTWANVASLPSRKIPYIMVGSTVI